MNEERSHSPFPGMDPYLEARWSDVHVSLIGFIREVLQPLLPRALRARAEERILLEEEDRPKPRSYRADVAVIETSIFSARSTSSQTESAVATVEPILIRRHPIPDFERRVTIIDVTNGNRVVTAIEVLSPWNKAGGRLNRDYRRKLNDYVSGEVSVVEIDLLRYPTRGRLPVSEVDIPLDRQAAYMTCIRLGWDPEIWRAYPMPLRSPLGAIPVPLRETDKEILLELQPLIDRVYISGGHDDIDYLRPLDPPLSDADAAWARDLIAKASGTA